MEHSKQAMNVTILRVRTASKSFYFEDNEDGLGCARVHLALLMNECLEKKQDNRTWPREMWIDRLAPRKTEELIFHGDDVSQLDRKFDEPRKIGLCFEFKCPQLTRGVCDNCSSYFCDDHILERHWTNAAFCNSCKRVFEQLRNVATGSNEEEKKEKNQEKKEEKKEKKKEKETNKRQKRKDRSSDPSPSPSPSCLGRERQLILAEMWEEDKKKFNMSTCEVCPKCRGPSTSRCPCAKKRFFDSVTDDELIEWKASHKDRN